MMSFGIPIFALCISIISVTPEPPRLQKIYDSDDSGDNGSEVLCSEAGNCSCLFEKTRVTVECFSVGDNFDEIASEIPKTSTHL